MIYNILAGMVIYLVGLVSAYVWSTYVPTARDAGFCVLRCFLKLFQAMMRTVFGEDSNMAIQSTRLTEVASTSQRAVTYYAADPQPMEVDLCHLDAPETAQSTMFQIPPGAVYCDTCSVWLNSSANYLKHKQDKKHIKKERAIATSMAAPTETASASTSVNPVCQYCNRYAPVPYVTCKFCGDTTLHHGSCCPENPDNAKRKVAAEPLCAPSRPGITAASDLFPDTASNGSFSIVSDLPGSTNLPPMGSADSNPLASLAKEFADCTQVYYYPVSFPAWNTYQPVETIPGGNRFHLFEDCAGQQNCDKSRRQSRKLCKCCLNKIKAAVSNS